MCTESFYTISDISKWMTIYCFWNIIPYRTGLCLYVQARRNQMEKRFKKSRKRTESKNDVLWHILGHSIYQENPPGGRASNKQTNKHNLFRHRTFVSKLAYQVLQKSLISLFIFFFQHINLKIYLVFAVLLSLIYSRFSKNKDFENHRYNRSRYNRYVVNISLEYIISLNLSFPSIAHQ